MIRRIHILAVLALLLGYAVAADASEWTYNDVDRIVALSDIHGAYDALKRTLQNSGVIDDSLGWCGGTTHLVIVGDLLDRGPDSRAAMDLLMRLEGEAAAAGGKVHVLIGNHEAMNLVGDLRYVSAGEYAAFAAEETAMERNRWFKHYEKRDGTADTEPKRAALRAAFRAAYPPGFFAHRRAFASDGIYGKWLLSKPVLVVINGTAFVHGGLSPMIAKIGLDGVNGELKQDLIGYVDALGVLYETGVLSPIDGFRSHERLLGGFMPRIHTSEETIAAVSAVIKLGESDLHAPDGPLWYRGNVYCPRLIGEDDLLVSLRAIDADRVVIGHTPTPGRRISQRMGGRVIEVDTGMLNNYYNGRGNALIIAGDSLTTISEESTEILTLAAHPRRVGARPGENLSVEALELLLRTGDIVSVLEAEAGRVFVTVTDGRNTIDALFSARQKKGFYADVAAYRLDRLLGLDLVPVTVVREVERDEGSLQFLPKQWQDEQQRGSNGLGGSAYCDLNNQWAAMYIFDTLIYNEGRSLQRMMYSPDVWQLILVGHDRAFTTKKGRPHHLVSVPLVVGDAWKTALAALTDELLEEELGDVLDRRRRKALLDRRDDLIE